MKTLQDLIQNKDILEDVINQSLFIINYGSALDRNDAKINLLKNYLSGLESCLNARNLEIVIKEKNETSF